MGGFGEGGPKGHIFSWWSPWAGLAALACVGTHLGASACPQLNSRQQGCPQFWLGWGMPIRPHLPSTQLGEFCMSAAISDPSSLGNKPRLGFCWGTLQCPEVYCRSPGEVAGGLALDAGWEAQSFPGTRSSAKAVGLPLGARPAHHTALLDWQGRAQGPGL